MLPPWATVQTPWDKCKSSNISFTLNGQKISPYGKLCYCPFTSEQNFLYFFWAAFVMLLQRNSSVLEVMRADHNVGIVTQILMCPLTKWVSIVWVVGCCFFSEKQQQLSIYPKSLSCKTWERDLKSFKLLHLFTRVFSFGESKASLKRSRIKLRPRNTWVLIWVKTEQLQKRWFVWVSVQSTPWHKRRTTINITKSYSFVEVATKQT